MFISELFDRKLAHRDGVDLEVRSNNTDVSIYAYDRGGRELAHVHFDKQPYVSDQERKPILVPYDLEVGEDYRGQGIAAIMYDYAKELGYEVQRSYEQTDAGAHFWEKNRGPDSKVWEGESTPAQQFIEKIYNQYPEWPYGQADRVMVWGEGEDQQFAAFKLKPGTTPTTVEIDWLMAGPEQRKGIGSRAIKELQRQAQEDNIRLTLYPWAKGQISQSSLTKLYKRHGFKPVAKGAKPMAWEPINEISPERLERYLARADKHVSNRMDRMSQARQRLSKSYEIYHADRPAGSAQIVDRFEADTPEQARQYYEKFIQTYDSDVDFDLRLRKGTGIMESVEAYHGTFQPTLTHFNALSHFGTLQAAQDRLKEKARREKIKTPSRIYQVILDIKNPFIAKDFAGVHSPTHFAFDLRDRKLISQEEMLKITTLSGDPRQAPALIKKLRELGFDSIAYKNKYEDKGSTSYVILDPSQVVSVKPVKVEEPVTEARLPRSVEDFLYDLTPEDVGVDEIGPWRIHYEGFTDDCQSSADYRKNPEAVYQQVFADHIKREGGRKPVEQNFTGDEDYPILYSIFRIPKQVKEVTTVPTVAKGKRAHLDVMPNGGKPIAPGEESEHMGKRIGKLGGVEVWTYNQGPMRTFVVFNPATRTSQLAVTGSSYPDNPNSLIIKGVYSGPRNETRAANLYAWLITRLGLTLVSDIKQSAGGQRVWQDLEKRFGRYVNIHGFNTKTNEPVNVGTLDDTETHVGQEQLPGATRDIKDIAKNIRLVASPK